MKLSLIFLLMLTILFQGCSQKGKLSKLMVLKNIAEEQESIENYVKNSDEDFERLLQASEQGTLDQYLTKQELINEFGKPIIEKSFMTDGKQSTEILYRYETKYFSGDKVYFYLNEKDEIISRKHYPWKEKEVDEELEVE